MRNADDFWFTGEIEQRQVQTSKGPVEYADVGQGIPILYFHGNDVGNDAVVMMEKSLVDDGFRLIVPNRPGYYGTPLQCGRSPNDCADLAAELLDQLRVERVVVIGTSGGGPPASRFAAPIRKEPSPWCFNAPCRIPSIPVDGCRAALGGCGQSFATSRYFYRSYGSAIADKPESLFAAILLPAA